MNSIKENRDRSMDIVAGFFICYMIVYHVCQWWHLTDSLGYHIMAYLNFFMPWFYFKSGKFFKACDAPTMAKKSSKRLLLPFIEWTIVGLIVMGCINVLYLHTQPLGQYLNYNAHVMLFDWGVAGNMPLWFLLSLFFVRNITNVCLNKHLPPVLLALVGIAIAIIMHFCIADFKFRYINVFSGLFFFAMGYWLKNINIERKWSIAILVIFIILSILARPYVDMKTNILTEGYYLLWPIWSLCGIISINSIFSLLQRHYSFPVLSYMGLHSMLLYVIHWPIIAVLYYCFYN